MLRGEAVCLGRVIGGREKLGLKQRQRGIHLVAPSIDQIRSSLPLRLLKAFAVTPGRRAR